MSFNLQDTAEQIKGNCNISDSRFWGYLSLCNMLLRMRELYFHEHNLRPWDKIDKGQVGDWISNRESLWETLEEKDLNRIRIGNSELEPFALDEINAVVEPHGYIYGGGYGVLKKPNFFLADLKKKENHKDLDVYYLGREVVHDLTPHVAMYQNEKIYIRMEIFENYLYQKFMELKKEFHADSLRKGFEYYKIDVNNYPQKPGAVFATLASELVPVLLWHELGEAGERPGEDQPLWQEMLAAADNKLTEIRLRAIKDVLADNSDGGTLKNIIEAKEEGMLYFHLSLIDESRKHAFGEVHSALCGFEKSRSWQQLDDARRKVREKAENTRNEALRLYKDKKDILSVAEFLKKQFS